MDENHPVRADPGYAAGRLAEALTTALGHDDPDVREAARRRAEDWRRVVAGMADGTLDIGSSAPVAGLPVWATPQVAHGGFATGRAAAGGGLLPHEEELAARLGLPATRAALYAHHLTEDGVARLVALLDGGDYEIDLPEQAALLVAAWLSRAGDASGARRLLAAVRPYADTLCLTPRPAPRHDLPAGTVHRATAGDVRERLDRRAARVTASGRPRAQQEALAVWNPFADRVLAHWWETVRDGRVDADRPDGWTARSAELLAEYDRLAAEHTLCAKHRKPKENLAILLAALREAPDGPPARLRGLLQHAVDSMVRKRGLPGSRGHTALRTAQAAHAARPTHDVLAGLLSARIARLPQNTGVPRIGAVLTPTTREEADRFRVPVAWPVPESLRRVALRAAAAPLDDLVGLGVVPSAEVMAEIVPALSAAAEASAAPDPALARLLTAHHRAFSRRRSLLLLNLASQVRVDRLPWIQELLPHLADRRSRREGVARLLPALGSSALSHFPGTILPNPLVREFNSLSRAADLRLPWVEELAADIFTGEFVPKFARAAKIAAELLAGTLYARYYDIDHARVLALDEVSPDDTSAGGITPFAALCRARAGHPRGGVAASGTVIEQAQILTTHNLATLVAVGTAPDAGWAALARRAHAVTTAQVERLPRVTAPFAQVRNAAFAWRQTVFYLSLCSEAEQREALEWMEGLAPGQPRHTRERLAPVLAGLRRAVDGAPLPEGESEGARPFVGWSLGRPWMLETAPHALLEAPRPRR